VFGGFDKSGVVVMLGEGGGRGGGWVFFNGESEKQAYNHDKRKRRTHLGSGGNFIVPTWRRDDRAIPEGTKREGEELTANQNTSSEGK